MLDLHRANDAYAASRLKADADTIKEFRSKVSLAGNVTADRDRLSSSVPLVSTGAFGHKVKSASPSFVSSAAERLSEVPLTGGSMSALCGQQLGFQCSSLSGSRLDLRCRQPRVR